MIFAISKFIAGLFGLDITKVQKAVLLAVMILVVVSVIVLGLWLRSCFHKEPKLDEKQIQKAEQAVKERNDEQLKEILAESDTRIENIDTGIKQAEENTRNAKKNYDGMTVDELAAEIERRK